MPHCDKVTQTNDGWMCVEGYCEDGYKLTNSNKTCCLASEDGCDECPEGS